MKVTRLVIGIISFVMALIVTFQSCFAGLGNAMEDNGEVGGSAGVVLAVVTRKGEGKGPFIAGGFYLAGGIIGLAMAGSYADLKIWGVACIIFALVFIIGTILEKKRR